MNQLLLSWEERTKAKLRYANVHLEELITRERSGYGDDFDRAHYEAFFFQLFGARDSFLQELNVFAACGLPEENVSIAALARTAQGKIGAIPGFEELRALETDKKSWLWLAKTMRHKAAHRMGNPLMFFAGAERNGQHSFKHPETGIELNEQALTTLQGLHTEMAKLLEFLRSHRTD